MLPVRRLIQCRLLAAFTAGMLAAIPVTTLADAGPATAQVDALWNQPQGVRVDSAFYVVEQWWDRLSVSAQGDARQRGLDALAGANADLLNAYTLLLERRTDPGPHPVAVIDSFLASVYNAVTGSNVKAPLGSLFHWMNRGLLKLEGRGSTETIVRDLIRDYQVKQAAAERDLHRPPAPEVDAIWTLNARRESALLVKIKGLTVPADGLAGALADADQTTMALAAIHRDGKGGARTGQPAGQVQGARPQPGGDGKGE